MARCKGKEKNQLKQLAKKGEWKAKNEINKGELTSTIRTSHQELHQQSSRDGEFLGREERQRNRRHPSDGPFFILPSPPHHPTSTVAPAA
jgi:hypothetical protein